MAEVKESSPAHDSVGFGQHLTMPTMTSSTEMEPSKSQAIWNLEGNRRKLH